MNLVVGLSSASILWVGGFTNVEGFTKASNPIVEVGGYGRVALAAMGMSSLTESTGLSVHVIHPTLFEEAGDLDELVDRILLAHLPLDPVRTGGGTEHPGGSVVQVVDHLVAALGVWLFLILDNVSPIHLHAGEIERVVITAAFILDLVEIGLGPFDAVPALGIAGGPQEDALFCFQLAYPVVPHPKLVLIVKDGPVEVGGDVVGLVGVVSAGSEDRLQPDLGLGVVERQVSLDGQEMIVDSEE